MSTELAAVVAAMVAGALVKSVTGAGLPPVAIPVLAHVVGVQEAVVIMSIPTFVTNGWMAWLHRRELSRARDLRVLVATGAVGGVAGAWFLDRLDEQVIALVLAAAVFAYVGTLLAGARVTLSQSAARRAAAPVGLVGGALQGATGLSGPVLITYLHAQRLAQPVFVLSVALLFQVFSIGQIAGLAAVGLYTRELVAQSLLATVVVTVVLALGARYAPKVSTRLFDLLVALVLVLSAGKLVVDAFPSLL